MNFSKCRIAAALVLGLAAASSANATNLVVNGGFDTLTNGIGQLTTNTVATGWSVPDGGYTFVFHGTTSDSEGSYGQYGYLALHGPANDSPTNGLGPSPDGGNFAGQDTAFQRQPLLQTIDGLTVGKDYTVSFYWAAAQQYGFNGPTTEAWDVTFGGGPTQSTAVYENPDHGFSGWFHESFVFKATDSKQVLSFFSYGTPGGQPPFALLDGVSVTGGVPEASTWLMLVAGFGFVGAATRRRARTTVAA